MLLLCTFYTERLHRLLHGVLLKAARIMCFIKHPFEVGLFRGTYKDTVPVLTISRWIISSPAGIETTWYTVYSC